MARAKLGRNHEQRRALFRSMVTALFDKEKIETTESKAHEVKAIADKMITLAKKGDLHSYRQVVAYLYSEDVAHKLFKNIAPRYTDRQGGYTRVVKTGHRRGDAAPLAILELV